MNISKSVLRQALRTNLTDIEKCLEEVVRQARRMGTEPQLIRDEHGNSVYAPLCIAKAQCLYSLTLLQKEEG